MILTFIENVFDFTHLPLSENLYFRYRNIAWRWRINKVKSQSNSSLCFHMWYCTYLKFSMNFHFTLQFTKILSSECVVFYLTNKRLSLVLKVYYHMVVSFKNSFFSSSDTLTEGSTWLFWSPVVRHSSIWLPITHFLTISTCFLEGNSEFENKGHSLFKREIITKR